MGKPLQQAIDKSQIKDAEIPEGSLGKIAADALSGSSLSNKADVPSAGPAVGAQPSTPQAEPASVPATAKKDTPASASASSMGATPIVSERAASEVEGGFSPAADVASAIPEASSGARTPKSPNTENVNSVGTAYQVPYADKVVKKRKLEDVPKQENEEEKLSPGVYRDRQNERPVNRYPVATATRAVKNRISGAFKEFLPIGHTAGKVSASHVDDAAVDAINNRPFNDLSTYVNKKAQAEANKEISERIDYRAEKHRLNTWYDTIIADAGINPCEISVGLDILVHLYQRGIRSKILETIVEKSQGKLTLEDITEGKKAVDEVVSLCNKILSQEETRVMIEKYPTTATGDEACFYLQIHPGRGIRMYPPMSKIANADFDGDCARITTASVSVGMRDAMDLITQPGFKQSLDEDFFPLPNIKEMQTLDDLFSRLPLLDQSFIREALTDQNKMYLAEQLNRKDYIRVASQIVSIANHAKVSRYKRAKITGAIFNEIYRLGRIQYAEGRIMLHCQQTGGDAYQEIMAMPDGKRSKSAENRVKEMLRSCLTSKNCFSYAMLKTAMNSNLEHVKGKSHEYRIVTDFGKYARRSDYIVWDEKTNEYIVRGEEGLLALYEGLVDHLYSLTMSSMSTEDAIGDGQKKEMISYILTHDRNGNEVAPLMPADFLGNGSKYGPEDIGWKNFIRVLDRRYRTYTSMVDAAAGTLYDDNSVLARSKFALKNPERKEKPKRDKYGNIIRDAKGEVIFEKDENNNPVYERLVGGDYSKMIVNIYSDLTLRAFLGDVYLDFLKKQNFNWGGKKVMDVIEPYLDQKIGDISIWNDVYVPGKKNGFKNEWDLELGEYPDRIEDILGLIFDHKSLKAQRFNNYYDEASGQAYEAMKKMRGELGTDLSKNWDAAKFFESSVEGMRLLCPDVYNSYGFGSVRGFMESEVGKAFLLARNPEDIRNIDFMERIKFRLNRVNDAIIRSKTAETVEAVEKYENLYTQEISALASSSPVWRVLANEFVSTNLGKVTYWAKMKETIPGIEPQNGRIKVKKLMGEGFAFIDSELWGSVEYETVWDMLFDEGLTYSEKITFLSDMTKYVTGEIVRQTDVMYLITRDRKSIYGEDRYQPRGGYEDALESLREAGDQFNAYKESTTEAEKQWETFFEKFCEGSEETANRHLERFFERIKSGEPLVHVPRIHLAEAMTHAAVIKTSEDTEKGQQQKTINSAFNAISLAVNGFVMTDWRDLTDGIFGQMAYEDAIKSPTFIIRCLADPDMHLTIKRPHRAPMEISHEAVFGGGDYVGFFKKHPSMILACRRHITNFLPDTKDGGAFIQSNSSFSWNVMAEDRGKIDNLDIIQDVVLDKPGFYASVAAHVNINNVSSLTSTSLYEAGITDTLRLIAGIAAEGSEASMKKFIEDNLDFSDKRRPENVSSEIWEQKKDRVKTHLLWCASQVRDRFESYYPATYQAELEKVAMTKPSIQNIVFFPNEPTLRTVEDVEQKFFSSKTATSVSANGAMSREIGSGAVFYSEAAEPCDAAPRTVSYEEIAANPTKYAGWKQASGGYLLLDDAMKIAERSSIKVGSVELYDPLDCTCKCRLCANHVPHDGSSSVKNTPVTPLANFTQIVRTDSTERLVLKYAKVGLPEIHKSGSEKLDSIVKTNAFELLKQSNVYLESIDLAYREGGLRAATEKLAYILHDVLFERGYDVLRADEFGGVSDYGLSINQLIGVAKAMLREDVLEDGSTRLRTESLRSALLEVKQSVNPREYASREEFIAAQDNVFTEAGSIESFSNEEGLYEEFFAQLKRHSAWRAHKAIEVKQGWGANFTKIVDYNRESPSVWSLSYEDKLNDSIAEIRSHAPKSFRVEPSSEEKQNAKKILGDESLAWAFSPANNNWRRFFNNWKIQGIVAEYDVLVNENGRNVVKKSNIETMSPDNMFGGPANCVFVTGEIHREQFELAFDVCKEKKIALCMDPDYMETYIKYLSTIKQSSVRENAVMVDAYGMNVLNFFEMEIMGESNVADNSVPAINVCSVAPDQFCRLVETVHPEFMDLADANAAVTEDFTERVKFSKPGDYRFAVADAFGFIGEAEDLRDVSYEIITARESEDLLDPRNGAYYDLGVAPTDKNVERFEKQLARLRSRWQQGLVNPDTGVLKECYPGEIATFAMLTGKDKDGNTIRCYSPVIPYDEVQGKGSAEMLTIDSVSIDRVSGEISVKWHSESKLGEGCYFKVFEGIHSSNKMIVHLFVKGGRKLRNGRHVDIFNHEAATTTRRIGTLLKDCMHTMIVEARHARFQEGKGAEAVQMGGYNVTDDPSFLSGRGETNETKLKRIEKLREGIRTGTSTMEQWRELMGNIGSDTVVEFYDDTFSNPELRNTVNEFVTTVVRRCLRVGVNPGVFLTSYVYVRGQKVHTDIYFRYDAILDNTLKCQDGLLAWFNYMMPWICPGKSSDTETPSSYMFIPSKKDDALVTLVPHYRDDGSVERVWEHMFTSIPTFSDDISMGKRPSKQQRYGSPSSVQNEILGGRKTGMSDIINLHDWGTVATSDPVGISPLSVVGLEAAQKAGEILKEIPDLPVVRNWKKKPSSSNKTEPKSDDTANVGGSMSRAELEGKLNRPSDIARDVVDSGKQPPQETKADETSNEEDADLARIGGSMSRAALEKMAPRPNEVADEVIPFDPMARDLEDLAYFMDLVKDW